MHFKTRMLWYEWDIRQTSHDVKVLRLEIISGDERFLVCINTNRKSKTLYDSKWKLDKTKDEVVFVRSSL